jgi:hypothetical protein
VKSSMQIAPREDEYQSFLAEGMRIQYTWVAMYAIEAWLVRVILWMRALPECVALGSLSTELGDVNTCLNALDHHVHDKSTIIEAQ